MTAAYQRWHDSPWFATWLRLARHAALMLACVWNVSGASYYVSTTGSAGNPGTLASPWSLQYAATNATVTTGDTVWIRGGTYSAVTFTTSGVTYRQQPSERAMLNGTVQATGSNTTLWGFEIYNSNANVRTNTSSALGPGLNLTGAGCRAINLVIHDTGAPGIWMPITATNSIVAGCVMWGIGLYQTDYVPPGLPRGPIFYGQANGTDGDVRVIRDNIVSKSWTEGLKAYGETANATGFTFANNVAFWNYLDGYLVDTSSQSITNFTMTGNISYVNAYDRIGELEVARETALIAGNTFVGDSHPYRKALSVHGWKYPTITNNVFVEVGSDMSARDTLVFLQGYFTNVGGIFTVNGNQYSGGSGVYGHWYKDNSPRYLWSEWQGLAGYDLAGLTNTIPSVNVVTVLPNPYETGRANITVLNWQGVNSTSVSLATIGLTNGQPFEIRDVQNWLGQPCVRGTYSVASPNVTLPLNLTLVTPVAGAGTHFLRDINTHTPTTFNAFVVLPQGKTVLQATTVRAGKVRRK